VPRRSKKRRRILIDVDEVLADFQTPAFDIINRLFGKSLTAYDYEVWDLFELFTKEEGDAIRAEMGRPGVCASLKVRPGALDAVRELRDMADVHPVTSPFDSPTWVAERYAWLQEHFQIPRRDVVFTESKYLVKGDALLDDRPDNITTWLKEHRRAVGMLWHIPNTRTMTQYDHLRVKTWDEVISKVKKLAGV